MQKKLLLGAEAIAQGAIDGGISGIYAYPGTPSTEITLYIQNSKTAKENAIFSNWSTNEKTAMEAALGMSYAGKRAVVSMKHVGLNVAADAFINSAITGINGGLVVVVSDDPSMHSSQNEQDSRFYGKFSLLPILEPSNQQEAYDMTREAFDLSESIGLPVLMRTTTRLSHSRSGVQTKEKAPENKNSFPEDPRQFVLLPSIARKRYRLLLNSQDELQRRAEESKYNVYEKGNDTTIGIVACGITYNYLMENFITEACPYDVVKIAQYPLPHKQLNELSERSDTILVLEDGYPLVEELLAGFFRKGTPVIGRLSGALPREGELNPDHIAKALGIKVEINNYTPALLTDRPPELCKGCGHIDMYTALNQVMAEFGDSRVFSDIGCYTLGALEPWNSINTCVEMGASITMAKGAADAGLFPSVAVIGDSTFTHSGMTGLLDAVNDKSPVTIIIADNSTTAMTGGQISSASGRIKSICIGIGVEPEHLREVEAFPSKIAEIKNVLKEEFEYKGTSVVIISRECVQTVLRRNKKLAKEKHNITI